MPNQTISGNKTFYYRFENNVDCPAVSSLDFTFKQPKKSETLQDITICKESATVLDAGSDFTSYLWSTGENTSSITVPPGDYYVDLGYNGCTYRQNVKVSAAETPIINNITVEGSTITINVSGGTPPYTYSIDGINWFSSNIFSNVSRGMHTAYVKDKYNCDPISKEFLILNLLNVITPNGDGYNDTLDYSNLRIYTEVSIDVYDRFGAKVYQSSPNQYVWDGKRNGRPVPTGSYWYTIKWKEPDTGHEKLYKGWVLVKER